MDATRRRRLTRLMLLSVAAALLTIALKTFAWLLTDSVGLLSDAAESLVNLLAACFALFVVRLSSRPPDEEHTYGHEKADYFSAGFEGALVMLAAILIAVPAVERLLNPHGLDEVGLGLAVTVVATLINLGVARTLIRAGADENSVTLEADGRHLMTDVWTSTGVVIAVAAVAITEIERLDPLIALAVAANIAITGLSLLRRSADGLMDRALPPEEQRPITDVLDRYEAGGVRFHALRTRRAGSVAFVSVHVLVPGGWSVKHGHDVVERIEADLREALGPASVFTHLEPVDDPASFEDTSLQRGLADEPAATRAGEAPSGEGGRGG